MKNIKVTYGSEGSSLIQTGLSSDPGQGTIVAARDYDKQFSSHFVSILVTPIIKTIFFLSLKSMGLTIYLIDSRIKVEMLDF